VCQIVVFFIVVLLCEVLINVQLGPPSAFHFLAGVLFFT
jgi:hypothetical protein